MIRRKAKSEKFNRNVITEGKFANKTVVKIMVTVGEFRFGSVVFMLAMFLSKLLCQMLKRVR